MPDTRSWAWYPGTRRPGFTAGNPDTVGSKGNGLEFDPASITVITFHDADGDGVIANDDPGDNSVAGNDRITVGGQTRTVWEVGRHADTTFVHKGTA